MPLAREIFQEGLIIPPIKLVKRGVLDEELMSFILANVRTPDEREGDLTAQIASNRVGESRLREISAKYGYKRVAHYAAATQDYAERVLRKTIAEIPDGTYRFEDFLDNDGFSAEPVHIRVAIRIDGDAAEVDFTGTDLQTSGGVNANLAITLSAYAVCLSLSCSGGCALQLRHLASYPRDRASRHGCECAPSICRSGRER